MFIVFSLAITYVKPIYKSPAVVRTHQFSVYVRRTAQGLGLRLLERDGLATVVGFSPIYFQNNNFLMSTSSGQEDVRGVVRAQAPLPPTAASAATVPAVVVDVSSGAGDDVDVDATIPGPANLAASISSVGVVSENSSLSNSAQKRSINPIREGDLVLAVNHVDAYTHTFQEVCGASSWLIYQLTLLIFLQHNLTLFSIILLSRICWSLSIKPNAMLFGFCC